MAHTFTLEAVVLKSYDVGEADRFCVLLTKERGRLAARARGVRKPKSRMGGTLLPCQHVSVTLHESSAGMQITAVSPCGEHHAHTDMMHFVRMQQATELLLALLHDEETLPDIFDLTLQYIQGTHGSPLSFTVKLLHLLGVLPGEGTDVFGTLSPSEQSFVQQCLSHTWPVQEPNLQGLHALCQRSIQLQTNTTMRSPAIVSLLGV